MYRAAFIFILVTVIMSGCRMKVKPAIDAGVDECENCSMIIQDIDQAAVAIDQNEELHTFCNPVCLIMEWNDHKKQESGDIWDNYLFSHNDEFPLNAKEAVIVQGDFRTAMGYGLLAFRDIEGAGAFLRDIEGEIIDWDILRVEYESPDRIIEINSGSGGDGQVREVERNSVLQVVFDNGSDFDDSIVLSGYDFKLTAEAGGSNSAKIIAQNPGEGFAFRNSKDEILALLRVTGDHTSEEAIYR